MKTKKKVTSRILFFSVSVFFILILFLFFAGYTYRVYELRVVDGMQGVTGVEPSDEVYVTFNVPVSKESVRNSFVIEPNVSGDVRFLGSVSDGYATKIGFKPDSHFEPDMTYTISAQNIRSVFGPELSSFSHSFATIDTPEIIGVDVADSEDVAVNSDFIVELSEESDYFSYEYKLYPEGEVELYKREESKHYLRPKSLLKQGIDYDLQVDQFFSSDNLSTSVTTNSTQRKYHFKTVEPLNVVSVSPENGGSVHYNLKEIQIEFNKHVDYATLENKLEITPEVSGRVGWDDKKLVFSADEFEKGQEYTVRLKSGLEAYEDTGVMENDFTFSFRTISHPKEIVPPADLQPVIDEGKYIDVDISDQVMTLFEDGVSRGSFQVSTGTYSTPTPYGNFKVINKIPNAYSQTYDLYMPYWMAFTYQGHGVHELPYWKYKGGAEYKERESNLGNKVSHGCVRLGVGPAELVYNFSDIGTPIVVHE